MTLALTRFNLALRGLMEFGVIIGFGYWGFHTGHNTSTSVLFGIGAPIIGFGFWGSVDFRNAGAFAEPLRLIQELVISGLAAVALYTAGSHIWGLMLGLVSIFHHGLVYILGNRLLKG